MTDLPRIIGITGTARSGKDTFASFLVKHQYPAIVVSLAMPMKHMLAEGLGFSWEQLYGDQKETIVPQFGKSARQMMQTLGTEWGRELVHEDMWLNALEMLYPDTNLIIADVRFQNEADWVRKNGILIHILRKHTPIKDSGHASEQGVDVGNKDFMWPNNGTIEELSRCALKTVQYLSKGNSL